MSGELVAVEAGGTEFYVELSGGQDLDAIGTDGRLTFDGVTETVAAIAGELQSAWERVKPQEASVAFGLKVTAKSGKLTGLLVEGSGEASLTVTLSWKRP